MRRSDFSYQLPASLIAQVPPPVRSDSRLLCLDRVRGDCVDRRMPDLPSLLRPGDLLVFNDTRVIPARLRGSWESGGKFEILLERLLPENRAMAQIRSGKPLRVGGCIRINGEVSAEILGRQDGFHLLQFDAASPILEVLHACGDIPLPPYISRPALPLDRDRYQTVLAARDGAVAAPTAGLHFDHQLLERLRNAGVERTSITLHIGAGTFRPVRAEDLGAHRMHREWVEVDAGACDRMRAVRAGGGRVVAVGTTVVRALETASPRGFVEPYSGETELFITPGYRFSAVDLLVTNFHMPYSTLLMLVCAFAGTERVLSAYRHAVRERYRFFSYGDAMFVSP